MKSNKFNTIFETAMSRYQRGGFLVGDVVTLKSGIQSTPEWKKLNTRLKTRIEDMVASGLHIRVTNITNAIPSALNADPAASTGEVYLDVALDEGGGRFSNQVVLPSHFFDSVEMEPGSSVPIPDVWKRHSKVNIKPEEFVEDEEHPTRLTMQKGEKLSKSELNLPSKNTSIPSKAASKSPEVGGMHEYLKELKKA